MFERRLYTENEDNYIIQHYNTSVDRDIALQLGRTIKSVRKRAKRLGMEAKKVMRKWTEKEDEVIRNRGKKCLSKVATKLDREHSEVCKRAKIIGFGFEGIKQCNKDGYSYKRIPMPDGSRKTIWRHIEVMESIIGRTLHEGELIHHIDCNKGNNEPDNLWLCDSISKHGKAHRSIEKLLPELIRNGIVYFDRTGGVYKICERETNKLPDA